MNTDSSAARRAILGHDPRALAAVFIGGAIGSGLRALLATLFPLQPDQWPWATFAANVAGAAALAWVLLVLNERLRYRRLLLGTGLCGGLTTFSTLQVEAVEMLTAHHYWLAASYLIASIAAGLLAALVVSRIVAVVQEERQ